MNAKRSTCMVLLLVFLAAQSFTEEPNPVYGNVLSWDIGNLVTFIPLILAAPSIHLIPSNGPVYERRLNKLVGFWGEIQFDILDSRSAFAACGVNFYPAKRALRGWYGGVSGHIGFVGTMNHTTVAGGLRSGYQWIFPSRFVLRLGAGCRTFYVIDTRVVDYLFNCEVALGFAF